MNSRDAEYDVERLVCGRHEETRSPETRSNRKPPLREAEGRVEGAELDEPDSRILPARHDAEADVPAGRLLLVCPFDEVLEAPNGRRRRRDEPRHLLGAQHGQQRRGIARPKMPQRELRARWNVNACPP